MYNLKTPISYYGGKQTMLKHIIPLIPEHSIYTESYCGGAAVLFAKDTVPCEVINDLNSEIINFYWMAQVYYPELKAEIDQTLHSREWHDHAQYIYNHPHFFTPAQRACAFWFLTKTSYASKLNGTFGFDFEGGMVKKLCNAKDALSVIKRYDKPDSFHFVDPPYVGTNCGHYEGMFNEQSLTELLVLLSQLQGKFMLTMFPNDHIKAYSDRYNWSIHVYERTISACKTNRRKQEEWIICNY